MLILRINRVLFSVDVACAIAYIAHMSMIDSCSLSQFFWRLMTTYSWDRVLRQLPRNIACLREKRLKYQYRQHGFAFVNMWLLENLRDRDGMMQNIPTHHNFTCFPSASAIQAPTRQWQFQARQITMSRGELTSDLPL